MIWKISFFIILHVLAFSLAEFDLFEGYWEEIPERRKNLVEFLKARSK